MKEEKVFHTYLKKKGMKYTPQRRVILKAVFSIHEHFDAETLFVRLRSKRKDISRATIYRTLPLLIESGLIKGVIYCENKLIYEHVFGHIHHDHMICIKCGKVIEFRDERIEALQEEVCKKYRFKAVEHRLGIRGYCDDCH